MDIIQVLKTAIELGASDVIISPDNYPSLKKSWEIVYLKDYGVVSGAELEKEVFSIIPESLRKKLQEKLELDFSINLEWYARFRVNGFKQRKGFGLVFRVIPNAIPEFESLKIPEIIRSFSDRKVGLVLITGGVGSWKSTTLASLINEINKHINIASRFCVKLYGRISLLTYTE